MSRTAAQALQALNSALRDAAGEEAGQQARLLLCHVLTCAPAKLALHHGDVLTPEQDRELQELLTRRQNREPLQYLLGEWAFMGMDFLVRPGALIPRQDTETLCEIALREAKLKGYRTALDLCCGTGCIGVSLAKLGGLTVTSSDISPECVSLTRDNAKKNDVRLNALQGSWFEPVTGRFDMIVCNPPYLTHEDMESMQPELRYEPALALFGGEDGLSAYRAIRGGYAAHIAPGGLLLLEVGAGQADDVCALFESATALPDYNGVLRVVCVRP